MGKDQHVTPHPNGGWQVKGAGNSRATVRTNTQREALNIGREISRNQGSELVIHGCNGQIRAKNPPFCIDFLSVCQKAAALQQSQGAHFALGSRIDFLHLIAQLVIRAHIGLEIIQILAHRFTIVPDITHRRRRAGGCVCRRQNSSRSRKQRDLGSARRLVRCRPVHRVEHGKGSAGGSRIRGNGGTAHCRAGMADCQRGCRETAPFFASSALLYTNLIVSAIKICAI